jgi:hypothetical protein
VRGPVSLSSFKNNIYFWELSKGQKCLQKSKMDKKNVQFSKTQGLYRNGNFPKVILHHNALNTEILIQKLLPENFYTFLRKGFRHFFY